jgi:hypothetical protein
VLVGGNYNDKVNDQFMNIENNEMLKPRNLFLEFDEGVLEDRVKLLNDTDVDANE